MSYRTRQDISTHKELLKEIITFKETSSSAMPEILKSKLWYMTPIKRKAIFLR